MTRAANLQPRQVTWFLDDVAGPFVAPWTWSLTRGTEPYAETILCPDDRFQPLENPVRLTIHAPDVRGQLKELRIENLYLLEKTTSLKGMRAYLLVDVRWKLASGSLTRSYNVQSPGSRFRENSLTEDGSLWFPAEATADGLTSVIASLETANEEIVIEPPQVVVATDDERLIGGEFLEPNLGNSRGGWFAANVEEFVPAMLGDLGDMTVTREGRIYIVDRTSEMVDVNQLADVQLDGELDVKDVHWQLPAICRLWFQKRVGRKFWAVSRKARHGYLPKLPVEIENVVPAYRAAPSTSGTEFLTFPEFLASADVQDFGLSNEILLERMTSPVIIPRNRLKGPARARADVVEQLIRTWFRRGWRITNDENRRKFADFRFGRLQPDGLIDDAAVIMDFTQMLKFQAVADAPLSKSVFDQVAPFDPVWVSFDAGVFYLKIADLPVAVSTVYPWIFEKEIGLPSIRDIVDDHRRPILESAGSIVEAWECDVYWSALQVADEIVEPNTPEGIFTFHYRSWFHDIELFAEGRGVVDIRADGITANFISTDLKNPAGGYGPAEGTEPTNLDQLVERAELIAAEIRASYEQPRAGTLEFDGVSVLTDGDIVGPVGDLHRIDIHIGSGEKEYEIRTVLDFRPAFRQPRPDPQSVDLADIV